MRDPHQNIFFYYRGPSSRNIDLAYDPQIEDNTTKSLINILEFLQEVQSSVLIELLLKKLGLPRRAVLSFALQQGRESSRPDAVICLEGYSIFIEAKVKADLYEDQLNRHLAHINTRDYLLIISNNKADSICLKQIKNNRLLFLTWADIHKLCIETLRQIKTDKKMAAVSHLLKHFVDYLEVVVMTEFSGFKDEDFDFWVDTNPYYVPILKRKLKAFAEIIKCNLPKEIAKVYSDLKIGNISTQVKDERFAWVAIKKPENRKDIFNQCNFTLEVSKQSLDINTVIRNGHITDKARPIGVFYERLGSKPYAFLDLIGKIKRNARIVVSKRLPKTGNRIMPGNEKWASFFDMRLKDITNNEDINYIRNIIKKADKSPAMPGIHFRYSIDRGNGKLAQPQELQTEVIEVIKEFNPLLSYLEGK